MLQDTAFKSYFSQLFMDEEAVIGKQASFSVGSPETTSHNADKFSQQRKVLFRPS